MKKIIFLGLLLTTCCFVIHKPVIAATKMPAAQMTITIKSSPDSQFQTRLTIGPGELVNDILHSKPKPATGKVSMSDSYVTIRHRQKKTSYMIAENGHFVNIKNGKVLILPGSTEKQVMNYVQMLQVKHYGEMLSWTKVKRMLPRKAVFDVIDLQTGRRLRVQRRAGDRHADVQPLSAEDTKIMKEIYEGKWSWRRRAVLVKADDQFIAASMHGMPHGEGALQNGFPGHFCIHFYQSKTHRSNQMDPAHEIMIYQSAGKIDEYLEGATPYELVDTFLIAINQSDMHLLSMTLSQGQLKTTESLIDNIKNIEAINVEDPVDKEDVSNDLAVKIPVNVRLYVKGEGDLKESATFYLRRNSPAEAWKIDQVTLGN
jgi:hypothetical protein